MDGTRDAFLKLLLPHLHIYMAKSRCENYESSSAAYQVGYESASQFSREYSRLFVRLRWGILNVRE